MEQTKEKRIDLIERAVWDALDLCGNTHEAISDLCYEHGWKHDASIELLRFNAIEIYWATCPPR